MGESFSPAPVIPDMAGTAYHVPGIAAAPNSGAQNVMTMKPANTRPPRGGEEDWLMKSA